MKIPRFSFLLNPKLKIFALYFLIGAIVYFNSLRNPFIWDDDALIVNNHLIRFWGDFFKIFSNDIIAQSNFVTSFYRPLQILSYAIDYLSWGLNPLGFHITSIALFIINAILVFFFVNLIIKNYWVSFVAGLFFLVHPIYPESVTYLSGRADILVGIFFLLGFIGFIKYSENQKLPWFLLSILSFCLALLSKEMALIFPITLLFYCLCFRKAQLLKLKAIFLRCLPFFIAAGIYIVLRLTVLLFGPAIPPSRETFLTRCVVFCNAIIAYLGMLFAPMDMHMYRDFYRPKFDLVTESSIFALLLISVFIYYFYKRQRILFFFCGWFFITLFPQSCLFPINSYISDHFIYLPAIGFFAILVFYLFKLIRNKVILSCVVSLVFVFYSYQTILHNYDWHDPVYFFKRIVKLSPRNWVSHDNLAENYVKQGKYEDAVREYRWGLALNIFDAKVPSIKQSMAQAYLLLNKPEEARKTINEILKACPYFSPFEIHFLLGDCYRIKGEFDPAVKEYMIALFLKPDYSLVRFRLTGLYLKLHKNELAIKEIADALSVDKTLLTDKGTPAIKDYEKVVEIKDSEAVSYTKLGMLFVNNNLTSLAKIAFQKAIERSSIYADPYWQLGAIYYKEGNKQEAFKLWKKAYRFDPQNPIAVSWRKNRNSR